MKKGILIPALLLVISVGNYFTLIQNKSARVVEFLSIFAIGALAGVLLTQIMISSRDKNKT